MRRQCAAWFAILGLYIQLAAAGLCPCCLPGLGPAETPICHTPAHTQHQARADAVQHDQARQNQPHEDLAQNDHAPAPRQDCPYCAVHCHAAMAIAPTVGVPLQMAAVPVALEPAAFIVAQAARFPVGAPPRGPPVLI